MKRKWVGIRVIIGLCAALGWWGLLYPELALTPDTVKVYMEEDNGELSEIPQEWSFDSGLYRDLLSADWDKITLRSKLLMDISSLWETFHDRNNVK